MAQAQIYISKRCPYCRKALMLLQQRQDLKGHIAVISIEDNPFPPQVKSVPVMISGNDLWSPEELFQFLQQAPIQGQHQQPQQQHQQQQHQQQQHQQQQQQPQQHQQQPMNAEPDIEGYCENGSCGLSFSSIDGNNVSNLSYSLLNDNPNSVPVENDGYVKKNERATKFDSDYEKMMEERGNMGMNGPQRH